MALDLLTGILSGIETEGSAILPRVPGDIGVMVTPENAIIGVE